MKKLLSIGFNLIVVIAAIILGLPLGRQMNMKKANVTAIPEPTSVIEEWPTPYPDDWGAENITAEGCEEYRYIEEDVFPMFDELWDEEAEEWAEDYELARFIRFLVTSSVASHNCSQYDPSYDDDYWHWAQHAYRFIDILEFRFYDEKYSTKD